MLHYIYLLQGDKLFNRKDYRSAINKYAEAIVISPNYPAAHYWKGYAHYYLNELDATVEELDTAFNQKHPPLDICRAPLVCQLSKGKLRRGVKRRSGGFAA